MNRKSALYSYLLCALFAALTAICSQIMIPLPFTPIPINLALLAVWVCGGVLGAKNGAIAILVYILLGAIGAPVFVGLQGGLGALAGPTGGYIVGYLPSVIVMGLLARRGLTADSGFLRFVFIIVRGILAAAACYACGTAWFMISTGTGFIPAMLMCVIPFIPGDILKLIAAEAVSAALRRAQKQKG